MKPLYYFHPPVPSSFYADAGEGTRSSGRRNAAPPHLLARIPQRALLGDQPMEASGCSAATGLLPAPSTQETQTCAGLSAPDWPFFLCLLLLSLPFSPCCHPISSPPPLPCLGICWKPEVSPSAALFKKRQILVGLCFPETKRFRTLPQMAAGDRNLPSLKEMSKPLSFFPFPYPELPPLPRPWQTGQSSASSRWLSKSKRKEAQLISVRSLKLQIKGGEGGEGGEK